MWVLLVSIYGLPWDLNISFIKNTQGLLQYPHHVKKFIGFQKLTHIFMTHMKVFHQINGFSLCNTHTWVQMICFLFTIGKVTTKSEYVNAISTFAQFVHLLCEKPITFLCLIHGYYLFCLKY